MYIHHDRGMHWNGQIHLLNQSQYREVLNDNGVRRCLLQKAQVIPRLCDFPFVKQVIDRNVHFLAKRMSHLDRLDHLRPAEIIAFTHHTHIETRPSEIDGITIGLDHFFENFKRSYWCKQLDFFSIKITCHSVSPLLYHNLVALPIRIV
ncbi:hypothetical protein D3C77_416770 [compost metagenome]